MHECTPLSPLAFTRHTLLEYRQVLTRNISTGTPGSLVGKRYPVVRTPGGLTNTSTRMPGWHPGAGVGGLWRYGRRDSGYPSMVRGKSRVGHDVGRRSDDQFSCAPLLQERQMLVCSPVLCYNSSQKDTSSSHHCGVPGSLVGKRHPFCCGKLRALLWKDVSGKNPEPS